MVVNKMLNVRYYDTQKFVKGGLNFFSVYGVGGGGHLTENASYSVKKFYTVLLIGERVYICPTILVDVAVCLVH